MFVNVVDKNSPVWLSVAGYADTCSWDACARMALFMRKGKFTDWERIIAAEENGEYLGFCAIKKPEGFPGFEYSPLIKWVFVEEKHRGKRISQKLLECACDYAGKIGFNSVYLTTWHKGLYEKYGFVKLFDKEKSDGYFEGIYEKKTGKINRRGETIENGAYHVF
ncbi:MAG: GNAT family N-acetyltransferase [Clostridiales bacterium]|jgi:GNAT superfamily N-acetyltransferase|nr:GNAT family N-acetyltransferase [Clostridiales bacterium]